MSNLLAFIGIVVIALAWLAAHLHAEARELRQPSGLRVGGRLRCSYCFTLQPTFKPWEYANGSCIRCDTCWLTRVLLPWWRVTP
jgi:hypothetical protein